MSGLQQPDTAAWNGHQPPWLAQAMTDAHQAREHLHRHITGWLGERECSQADFAAAVAASTGGDGEPLWGMMIAPASSAKTETVRMASGVRNASLDEFTSASLLSFSKAKVPQPVGVLMRIPPKALITVADFSTILASSDKGLRDQLFADLRRVYDGELHRDLGTMPRGLSWRGRVTMLAASTPAIDDYASHSDKLGPRWLCYRGTAAVNPTAARRAGAARRLSEQQLERNRARACELFTMMALAAMAAYPHISLTSAAEAELADIAVTATLLRSPVPRDGYGRREIIGLPVTEEPYRLNAQLRSLTRGLMAIGYPEGGAADMARRCAMDTVPPVRIRVLMPLRDGASLTHAAVGKITGMDRKVARRALEDLRALGITECPVEDNDLMVEDTASYVFRDKDDHVIPKRWRLAMPDPYTDEAEKVNLATYAARKLATSQNAVPKMEEALSSSLNIKEESCIASRCFRG